MSKRTDDSPRARVVGKDEQVDHILQLMLNGQWQGAKSNGELAQTWACHPRTVSDRACEASAVLKRIGGPVEDYVAKAMAEIDADIATARAEGEWGAVMKGHELKAKLKGALIQKREDVTDTRKKLATMTAEERIKLHEDAIERERAGLAETRH